MPDPDPIPSRQITPLDTYLNRRNFLRAGLTAASVLATGAAYRGLNRPGSTAVETPRLANLVVRTGPDGRGNAFQLDEPLTPLPRILTDVTTLIGRKH